MPAYATYVCADCGDTQDVRKPYGEDFPSAVECPICNAQTAFRDFSFSRVIGKVEEGMTGNAADGYSGRSARKPGIDPTAAKHW